MQQLVIKTKQNQITTHLSELVLLGETAEGQYCTNLNTLLLFM